MIASHRAPRSLVLYRATVATQPTSNAWGSTYIAEPCSDYKNDITQLRNRDLGACERRALSERELERLCRAGRDPEFVLADRRNPSCRPAPGNLPQPHALPERLRIP